MIDSIIAAVCRAIGARRRWRQRAQQPWKCVRVLPFVALLLTALASAPRPLLGPPLHEVALLKPQTGKLEPRFGRCVALAGKSAVIGSPADADDGTAGGSVHVFGDSKSGWRRAQRLVSSDPAAEDRFGQAVAGDGSRIVIGRDRADEGATDAGAAVVLRRVGYHYRAEADLFPEHPNAAENFGGAVAIDGTTIVVGASRDDTAGVDAGSARIFTFADGAWTPTMTLLAPDAASADWFGHSVAVSGNVIAIGAYGDDDRGEKSGAVYLWERIGETWKLDTKLVPDDLQPHDWFGYACAMDGDLLAIGAPRDDGSGESAGCVRVYRKSRRANAKGGQSQDSWTLEAAIRPDPGSVTAWFGYAVAVDDGRLLVGAPGNDTDGESAGAAVLFRGQRGAWAPTVMLLPSSPSIGALFGSSVALRGELAVVGRNWDEDAEQVPGSAWVFRLKSAAGSTATVPSTKQGQKQSQNQSEKPGAKQRSSDVVPPQQPAPDAAPASTPTPQAPKSISTPRIASDWTTSAEARPP